MNLIEFQLKYSNEEECIKDLEIRRWGKNNAICPFCESNHFCKHNTRHIYTCMDCKKQYSVRMGTIFESSRLPLNKWYLAIYLFTSLKKGISSHQLSKYLSITQKTAWFMLQRIREVMKNDNNNSESGTFEADEAYIGGSETNKHSSKKGKDDKVCVFGIVNRNTKQVKAYKVSSNEKDVLLGKIYSNIKDGSTILTDSYNGYDDLKKYYNHEFVKHCAGEYNRDKKDNQGRTAYKINTNSIEGFWSQLKRGIYGVYHWASKKHIQRYINEFCYRYNNRLMNDIEIFANWFGGCENKRVYYKCLVG